jgi:hypothetical protein
MDYRCNFVDSMAFGIYYVRYFRRMDSHAFDNSGCGNRHKTASRQAGFIKTGFFAMHILRALGKAGVLK